MYNVEYKTTTLQDSVLWVELLIPHEVLVSRSKSENTVSLLFLNYDLPLPRGGPEMIVGSGYRIVVPIMVLSISNLPSVCVLVRP